MIKRYQPYILRQHHCHDSAEMCQHDKGEFTLVSDLETLQKQCDIYREALEKISGNLDVDGNSRWCEDEEAMRYEAQQALKRGE